MCFPAGSDCKEPARNAGDLGSSPGLGRALGNGHGNPLQSSCWKIPRPEEPGAGAAGAATIPRGLKESNRLSDFHFNFTCANSECGEGAFHVGTQNSCSGANRPIPPTPSSGSAPQGRWLRCLRRLRCGIFGRRPLRVRRYTCLRSARFLPEASSGAGWSKFCMACIASKIWILKNWPGKEGCSRFVGQMWRWWRGDLAASRVPG